MKKIALLENPVQQYAWGSRTFIQDLVDERSPVAEPQAELWMGAHPRAPSTVILQGKRTSLLELIRENPIDILGKSVAGRFGNTLPFLFKVLAAAKPLSIQAHPNGDKAREGFERENRQKIPLNASNRNYKDENHKPEIICALKPFWALKGFRKVEEILLLLDTIGALSLEDERNALRGQPNREGLKNFFKALIALEKGRQAQIISEVLEGCKRVTEQYPAMEWVGKLSESYPNDIGILSPILMNPVHLQEGEAINIPAGELHAYLEGAGIELMANSDNVLRGGLTPKHVDVQELLNILTFKTGEIDPLKPKPRKDGEKVYATATDEYILSVLDIHKDTPFKSSTERSVEIMICVDGTARITDLGSSDGLALKKGTSFIVPAAAEQYQIEGTATIYKASIPLSSSAE
jgi:mannose-6-phosphate isomerase